MVLMIKYDKRCFDKTTYLIWWIVIEHSHIYYNSYLKLLSHVHTITLLSACAWYHSYLKEYVIILIYKNMSPFLSKRIWYHSYLHAYVMILMMKVNTKVTIDFIIVNSFTKTSFFFTHYKRIKHALLVAISYLF